MARRCGPKVTSLMLWCPISTVICAVQPNVTIPHHNKLLLLFLKHSHRLTHKCFFFIELSYLVYFLSKPYSF